MALALPLFVAWIRTNDPDDAIAPDDLAFTTNLLDRCLYFHDLLLLILR